MDIQTAAKYMDQGYRFKRSSWLLEDFWISKATVDNGDNLLKIEDLIADDWEIILEGITDNTGFVKYK